jgi:hypothetical protein
MTLDYSISMQDKAGRVVTLNINGASIDDMVADGYNLTESKESVESDTFARAIAAGDIGADAWLCPLE